MFFAKRLQADTKTVMWLGLTVDEQHKPFHEFLACVT